LLIHSYALKIASTHISYLNHINMFKAELIHQQHRVSQKT